MYALKCLAIKDKKFPKDVYAPEFAKSFVVLINRYGRNHEPELLTRYFLKTNPFNMIKNASLGLKLLQRGRFPFLPERIKGIKQLQQIIKKAESLGDI